VKTSLKLPNRKIKSNEKEKLGMKGRREGRKETRR